MLDFNFQHANVIPSFFDCFLPLFQKVGRVLLDKAFQSEPFPGVVRDNARSAKGNHASVFRGEIRLHYLVFADNAEGNLVVSFMPSILCPSVAQWIKMLPS
jgi:hypothetical protein